MEEKTKVKTLDVSKVKARAAQASPVMQMARVFQRGKEVGALVGEEGEILANGMLLSDAAFYALARQDVLQMADELQRLQDYADYVNGVVQLAEIMLGNGIQQSMLPMPYEKWVELRSQGVEL